MNPPLKQGACSYGFGPLIPPRHHWLHDKSPGTSRDDSRREGIRKPSEATGDAEEAILSRTVVIVYLTPSSVDEWLNEWAITSKSAVDRIDPELERWFREKADTWRRETGFMSVISKKVMHPAYQVIMTKGEPVLPLILRELRDRGGHWFWALSAIAEENPTRPDATLEQAKQDWLEWGSRRGLID